MSDQFKLIRRAFNVLGSRWVTTGSMAAYIHAKHLGVTIRKPNNFDFVIAHKNRDKFERVLLKMGYELITTKSSRNNLRFEKRHRFPVNLILTQASLSYVSYNSTPIQNIKTLLNAKNKNSPNVKQLKNLLTEKHRIHSIVKNLMSTGMSLN